MSFSEKLKDWFDIHKRSLPWRETNDPYIIWLSEIILQQTRVRQGLPYFTAFKERFPNVNALAVASQDEVLKMWEGLGYYSRARNMHYAARQVVDEYGGRFPCYYNNLIKLKGVGDYTASAVASISNNEKVAVVDGNVFRVLSRIFGITKPINTNEGSRIFKNKANSLLPDNETGIYNQALMEFGALQCVPKNPHCSTCPFNSICYAFKNSLQQQLPVKLKKTSVKTVYMNYLIPVDPSGKTLIYKRKGKGIWEGLFEFPLLESNKPVDKEYIRNSEIFQEVVKKADYQLHLYNRQPKKHLLTHRKLLASFWIIEIDHIDAELENYYHITDKIKIENFAFPVLLSNFIRKFFFFT